MSDFEVINSIILFYEAHRHLWDPTHHHYQNKHLKSKSLATLCIRLKMSEKEIKTKWNSARTYFRKLNKVHKDKVRANSMSGAGNVQVDIPVWGHYQSMQFLEKSFELRPSISNLDGIMINKDDYADDNLLSDEEILEISRSPTYRSFPSTSRHPPPPSTHPSYLSTPMPVPSLATSIPTSLAISIPPYLATSIPTSPATSIPTSLATSIPPSPATSIPPYLATSIPTSLATSIPPSLGTFIPHSLATSMPPSPLTLTSLTSLHPPSSTTSRSPPSPVDNPYIPSIHHTPSTSANLEPQRNLTSHTTTPARRRKRNVSSFNDSHKIFEKLTDIVENTKPVQPTWLEGWVIFIHGLVRELPNADRLEISKNVNDYVMKKCDQFYNKSN